MPTRQPRGRPAKSRGSRRSSPSQSWFSSTVTSWSERSADAVNTWTCGSWRLPTTTRRTQSARSRSPSGGGRSMSCPRAPDATSSLWWHWPVPSCTSPDPISTEHRSGTVLGLSTTGFGASAVFGRGGGVGSGHELVLRPLESSRGRDAFEIATCPLGAWVGLQQRPELTAVTRLQQMRQLVQDHVVKNPGRHPLDPSGDPDRPLARRAGTPPGALVGDPGNAERLGQSTEITSRQVGRTLEQLLVARASAFVPRSQLAHHGVDPRAFLIGREARRDEHDGPAALAIGADRPASAPAAPDLDLVPVHDQNLSPGTDKSHRYGLLNITSARSGRRHECGRAKPEHEKRGPMRDVVLSLV